MNLIFFITLMHHYYYYFYFLAVLGLHRVSELPRETKLETL